MSLKFKLTLAILTLTLASLLSISAGSPWVPLTYLFQVSTEHNININQLVLTELRLPRLAAAILTGSALGCAGFLLQRLSQNPLTSPSTLGITQGAALALVCLFISGIEMLPWVRFISAMIGALLSGLLLVSLFYAAKTKTDTSTLLLLGALLSSLFAALTTCLLLLDQHAINSIRFWLSGSLEFIPAQLLPELALICSVGYLASYLMLPALNLISTGDAKASSLGASPQRIYLSIMAIVFLLTGASVAIAGPILFTGLVVPQLARLTFGIQAKDHLTGSILLGAVLMVLADGLTRLISPDNPISPSIPMAIIGAPWFIALVYQRYRR